MHPAGMQLYVVPCMYAVLESKQKHHVEEVKRMEQAGSASEQTKLVQTEKERWLLGSGPWPGTIVQ